MSETRPRWLELFSGAGGSAMGYYRAGWHVTCVDLTPQPRCPFDFIQADALTFPLDGFDGIGASPPCQAFSRAKHLRAAQGGTASSGDLLTPTLARLADVNVPWVVENVEGAPMEGLTLCGSMFGLGVRRHRVFASNMALLAPGPCDHRAQGRPVGVYHVMGDEIPHGGRTAKTLAEAQEAMGIDWMEWSELKEAIPPAYTEWLGAQLLAAVPVGDRR